MRLFLLGVFIFAAITSVRSQTLEQLADICIAGTDGVTYLRDFKVELEAAQPGRPEPVAKYSMVLNKNTQYRLSVCNSEASQGSGIIKIFDNRGMIASNYVSSTDTAYQFFDIQIQSTGIYHIFISFRDGLPGTAVAVLAFVNRL